MNAAMALVILAAFLDPTPAPEKPRVPEYVKPDAFREKELAVGAGDWALPGTLSLPTGDGPFPVVILVHGSGPHDRDETIGPNKPFRDLAQGLASRGVAAFRYEKRTKAHGKAMVVKKVPITVENEVIEDVLLAVQAVKKEKGIDPKRVFVLGHSLGGYLAPWAAKKDEGVAGLVILAGNTRPLEDLVLDQYEYLIPLQVKDEDKRKEILDKTRTQVALVKGDKLTAETPAKDLPLGIPAEYWLALRGYDPGKTATTLKRPMLVLQGERDYQVTMDDFAGWKKALEGRKDVTTKSYSDLNHLFMTGKGKATPAEYLLVAGFVKEEVVADIADWVKR